MWAQEEVRYVYASNAIEGSTLTLGETLVVIEQGITVNGKPLRDHIDAVNGKKALDFVYALVDARRDLDITALLEIHELVVGADSGWGGRIRDDRRYIQGSMYVPPAPVRASEAIDEVFTDYRARKSTEHPVLLAADLHFGIVHVHPFKDGNGRTARLAMNVHLVQSGFPPLAIMPEQRAVYIDALEKGHFGEIGPFRQFIYSSEKAELERYLGDLALEPIDRGLRRPGGGRRL